MFLNLQELKNKIVINGSINAYDINPILINMFINIRDNPIDLYKYIKKLIHHNNYYIKDNNNHDSSNNNNHHHSLSSQSY